MPNTTIQHQIAKSMAHIHAALFKLVADGGITKTAVAEGVRPWAIQLCNQVPASGNQRTYYFVEGSGSGRKAGNLYDVYIFVEKEVDGGETVTEIEKIGQVSYDMRDHMPTVEFTSALNNYRDTSDPIPTNASAYTNDKYFVQIRYTGSNTTKSKFDFSEDPTFSLGSTINMCNPLDTSSADITVLENDLFTKDEFDFCMDALLGALNT